MNTPKVLACVPQSEEIQKKIEALSGITCRPYAGSVLGTCQLCGTGIWLGPRQQILVAAEPAVSMVCFPCASLFARTGSPVKDLGNPEPRGTPSR